ncbi:MAG: zinc ABC transporter substrate-binding protein [Synergistaceae bacterium]|nr:zinc ABC transporter substrate-binding protein [Synergistaceae bacterium]
MKIKLLVSLMIAAFAMSAQASEKDFSIVCSLFPVCDFAREVAGDSASVHLLLRPGTEPHDFEPSPLDMKTLNDSDVFIFTGEHMEEWAKRISRSLNNTFIIDSSTNIETRGTDPHVWLDLDKARAMVMNIAEGLSKAKPEHSEKFSRNATAYCGKLSELDEKFMTLDKKTLVFAGEFAFGYFVERYGFDYVSAYDGENEPSIRRMAEILKFIRDNQVKYIFADAYGLSDVTRSIAEQTGAEILIFYSGERDSGMTFLELMSANYESLRKFIYE